MPHPLGTLAPTGDPNADSLLNTDPLALIIGMLLDQQVSISWAFAGPLKIRDRLAQRNVAFTARSIVELGEDGMVDVCCEKPAVHRYPAVMARRLHALCVWIDENHDGDPSTIWETPVSAAVLAQRVSELPGFGEEKSMIFVALLAKRFGIGPSGWEKHAGPFADGLPRTVADVDSPEAMNAVKAWKKQQRQSGKTKQD